MKKRHIYFVSALGVLAALTGIGETDLAAQAAGIEVPMDQVRIVTFNSPVRTVYVGNPVIADITVIDSTHVFLLGKNFGMTNIVALDGAGRQSFNEQVSVVERNGSTVTVQRGAAKSTMMCTSARCEASPAPGDDKAPYDAVTGQIQSRETLNASAAGAGR
jgi:Pilus formation protein N terminal region